MIMKNEPNQPDQPDERDEPDQPDQPKHSHRQIIVPGLILPPGETVKMNTFPILFKGNIISDQISPDGAMAQFDETIKMIAVMCVNFRLIPLSVFMGQEDATFLDLIAQLHIKEYKAEKEKEEEKEDGVDEVDSNG